MKIICWNIRGLGNPREVRRLLFSLKQQNPQMVFFMETKINEKWMKKIRRRCGFGNGIDVSAEGSRGGICLAWKEDIQVSLKIFSLTHIDVLVKGENITDEWRFKGFYGSPYIQNKNVSWNLLRNLGKESDHPWLVGGDFNEIMYSFENSGGQQREEKMMEAFREVLEECHLTDVGYTGVWFTWERGNMAETNIRERLDRDVANEKWIKLFPRGNVHHLTSSLSDHCPLLINTTIGYNFMGIPKFKFEAWWTIEESLEQEVKKM
ncbi:uncharacterized protein LOC108478216 [Gossypium arboreum]|uniref:uncharacterized protein LOC108478216 n=1 Tax=Gossypium arboreum TaxID=29729 RepID=UPI0008191F0B|nr:uncharacterized protein LOC108478216 [Gossypium arboreum]